MTKYRYSAVTNEFFPYSLKDSYLASGQWPDVGHDFEEEDFIIWKSENAPHGKTRSAGEKGLPEWVDIPQFTQEELERIAIIKKQSLIDAANDFMNSKQWPGKAALGRIKDAEKQQYNHWLDYLDLLDALNVSGAEPIVWPESPEV